MIEIKINVSSLHHFMYLYFYPFSSFNLKNMEITNQLIVAQENRGRVLKNAKHIHFC